MGIRSLSSASISTGAKRSKFWDQTATLSNASYEAIQSYSLTGSQASVEFTSIPQTYRSLVVTTFNLTNTYSTGAYFYLNSDTTLTNYNYSALYSVGTGSGTSTYGNTTISPNFMGGSTSQPGYGSFMIQDYTSTSKYKVWRGVDGAIDDGTSPYNNNIGGVYNSTNAITALRMTIVSSRTWSAGSTITLYGIK